MYCLWFSAEFNKVFCTPGLIFWGLSLAMESIIFWHWCVRGKLLSPLSVRSKADLSTLQQVVSHHLCRQGLLSLEHPPSLGVSCLTQTSRGMNFHAKWFEIRSIGSVEAGATWAVSILFCEQLRNGVGGTTSGEHVWHICGCKYQPKENPVSFVFSPVSCPSVWYLSPFCSSSKGLENEGPVPLPVWRDFFLSDALA